MTKRYSDHDRTLALAGIFQAARLTRDIAREGDADHRTWRCSIDSLFVYDADAVAEVFGSASCLSVGLSTLASQMDKPQQRDYEIARYAVALIHLADKLRRDNAKMTTIHDALTNLQQKVRNFDLTTSVLAVQLADIYRENISVMTPQIMVKGEPLYLQNAENSARIRAVLLAGIRSAVLWRQCHGKKRQLLFQRRKLVEIAHGIIRDTKPEP